MSDEPLTHKLDAHELMKFLDQLAPDVKEEQRAQLVFVDQRLQRVDASAQPPAPRMPDSHPFAQARRGQIRPLAEPARERPIELTMLDAERVLDADLLSSRWARRPTRRAIVGGAVGLALFALLAIAAARSRDQHASAGRPPPLPQPAGMSDDTRREARAGGVGASAGAHAAAAHSTAAAEVAQGRQTAAPSAVDHALPEEHRALTRGAQPGPADVASGRPADVLAEADRADAAALRKTASERALQPADAPTGRTGGNQGGGVLQHGSRRNAVDLLLAGESRAALDAYRALTRGGVADPALAQVVRLLELELSTCGGGEAAACRP